MIQVSFGGHDKGRFDMRVIEYVRLHKSGVSVVWLSAINIRGDEDEQPTD